MEILIMLFTLAGILLVILVTEAVHSRQEEKRFTKKLYEDFGKVQEREYAPERFARLDSYFRRHPQDGQIDDITWDDLGMDDIFTRINCT